MSARVTITRPRPAFQPKTWATTSLDPAEREAERVAAQLGGAPPERVGAAPPAGVVPPAAERIVAGPGRGLEPAVQGDMERSLGHDFSRVRVHTGPGAEASARELAARAYTVGSAVV